ncbi:MAG: glycosyltransferase family 4 protein [Methanothrix sp.]|nr:glycosyltransferase family 4 protein [Methanothrix sp.]
MDIWIFNHYAHPPDLPGGTRHYDLGRELLRRGHRVVIFASSFHHYIHRETRLGPREAWRLEEVDGVKFVWLRTPPYTCNDLNRVRNMVAYMLRACHLGRKLPRLLPHVGQPDVVIGSSVHLLAVLAALWVARRYHAKFVMEVRDLWPQAIVDMVVLSERSPVVWLLRRLEKYLYTCSERIVVLGLQMFDYMSRLGVPRDRIVWIPNGVDLSRFTAAPPGPAGGNGFRVLYLGAHSQSKELDVLIRAAKMIQDWNYVDISCALVGDGPEKSRLIALAAELGLVNVRFYDPVPKTEVPMVLHEASALLIVEEAKFFSYGGSILKLSEYMAVAKPIIFCVNAPHNPVEEARCGITVPPRQPEALANAILKLYQMSPEDRAAMGRRGRAYVEEHHDIRKLAERLEGVLVDVVHGP